MADLNHQAKLSGEQISNVINLYKCGQYQKAINQIKLLNESYPNVPILFNLVGLCYKALGQFESSVKMFKTAVDLKPDYAEALNNLGDLLKHLGQLNNALISYEKAINANPNFLEAHNNLGITLNELGLYEDAIKSYYKAITINPSFAEVFNNLGNAQRKLGQIDDAINSYAKAISINENFLEGYFNLGETLRQNKQLEASILKLNRAIFLNPKYAKAHNSLGLCFAVLGEMSSAIDSFKEAINIDPKYAEAHYSLGNTLNMIGDVEAGINCLLRAIEINPNFAEAYKSLGNSYKKIKQKELSLEYFEKAMSINSDLDYIVGDILNLKMHLCDWTDIKNLINKLIKRININDKVIRPFYLFSLADDPNLEIKAHKIYSNDKFPKSDLLPQIKHYPKHKKIRIGYFSGDFREHPVSTLTAGLYENHDRDFFEIHAFSYGPDTNDEMNLRIKAGVDYFHEVQMKPHKDIALLSRSLEIDIAVDLGGYTAGAKTDIFAMSAAPIQLSYIGFLGTMGADYYDYLISDITIIPEDSQKYYSEKIIYLPYFQANDSKQTYSIRNYSREDIGLPEKGFVFCCFNNTYKFTPSSFDSWCRILKAVNNSVLLLYASNKAAEKNLTKEIAQRGIDSKRIIFGEHLPLEEYLGRYRVVDLFLDTNPYNAGTTSSDAMRMGLPVITLQGKSFSSRMGASILKAINMPELIASNQNEYESMAIELATNSKKMKEVKEKLSNNIKTAPLFNTALFTKHLESAYKTIYERHHDGLRPEHIYVEDSK
ncbi:tetratricopeptide repeat protein [Candidatus Thioglobus sp.]|nr:tetratricopeptide repeat protein [Candidatus Thioglobus sp.]